MAALRLHRQRWQTKVRIPKALRASYGDREYLYRHLATSDRRKAQAEADAWEAALRLEWQAKAHDKEATPRVLRQLYEELKQRAAAGAFEVELADEDPIEAGIEWELDKLADAIGERELEPAEEIQVAALQDAKRQRQGKRAPFRV